MLSDSSSKTGNQLLDALNQAQIGVWHIQLQEGLIKVNDYFSQLTGFESEQIAPITFTNWDEFRETNTHPFIKQVFEKLKEVIGGSFSCECKLRDTAGNWLDVQVNGQVSAYDERGIPSQITGTIFNLSNTEISKQSLDYRFQMEKLVSDISSEFMKSNYEFLDQTIDRTLQKIGNFCINRPSLCFLGELEQRSNG